ncbi:hypothetical protein [Nocardia suismassiliense]|uniref:hypothetical protein n=1 Tax=Nocardia suismassiliense TaxID=2077092 RepID=UPI000D1DF0CC|nr:hypothetical protein [Nocardia suismassiliense]
MTVLAQPPAEPQQLPEQVFGPLSTLFGWFVWFATLLAIASFVATVSMIVWQRRSASSTHLLEEAALIRICIASAILSAAMPIAQELMR